VVLGNVLDAHDPYFKVVLYLQERPLWKFIEITILIKRIEFHFGLFYVVSPQLWQISALIELSQRIQLANLGGNRKFNLKATRIAPTKYFTT